MRRGASRFHFCGMGRARTGLLAPVDQFCNGGERGCDCFSERVQRLHLGFVYNVGIVNVMFEYIKVKS